jgi:uncharacterized protein (DUF433 family)
MAKDNWEDRIDSVPGILEGKAIIAGTRISVEFILGLLAEGIPEKEILEQYPTLTHEDVLASLRYALELVEDTKFYRIPPREHASSPAS